MSNLKKNSFKQFNKAARHYDFHAFDKSLGLNYLSYLDKLFIQKHIKRDRKKKLFLDLGIGTGRISSILLERNIKVKAMDFSNEMLKLSQQNLAPYVKKRQLQVYLGDLNNKLPFANNSFDGVLSIRVIKYVKNWRQAIDEISRVTKPNGVFILDYSNFYSAQTLSRFYAGYLTFKPSEINHYLLESGFKVIDTMYGAKLPFYLYKYANSESKLKKLRWVERALQNQLKAFLSRNIIVYCQKIGSAKNSNATHKNQNGK